MSMEEYFQKINREQNWNVYSEHDFYPYIRSVFMNQDVFEIYGDGAPGNIYADCKGEELRTEPLKSMFRKTLDDEHYELYLKSAAFSIDGEGHPCFYTEKGERIYPCF